LLSLSQDAKLRTVLTAIPKIKNLVIVILFKAVQ
jgi:hypothetical protein